MENEKVCDLVNVKFCCSFMARGWRNLTYVPNCPACGAKIIWPEEVKKELDRQW